MLHEHNIHFFNNIMTGIYNIYKTFNLVFDNHQKKKK